MHIMKALSSHPLAAQSLTEDDSLQVLFEMIKSGSLTAFALFKEGLVSLHAIQLHRHAMQVKYIIGHAQPLFNNNFSNEVL